MLFRSRAVWKSNASHPEENEEIAAAWGSKWAKAAVTREWIMPFADGRFHLEDPVTRGALALALSSVERRWGPVASPAAPDTTTVAFPDVGPRHYLYRAATRATLAGLPSRGESGRFEPWASATGTEAMQAIRGLARRLGASPVVSPEQH